MSRHNVFYVGHVHLTTRWEVRTGYERHSLKHGLDSGLDSGLWTLDPGPWTLDSGLWTLDSGLWTIFFYKKLKLIKYYKMLNINMKYFQYIY